jgi:predicted transposase YbfD/YdcC
MDINGFISYFDELKDPSIDRSKKHLLSDILVIAILSFICGAESWEDIEDFGHAQENWLKQGLALPHGIPSHDTFARVFARLNPQAFQNSFVELMKVWHQQSDGDLIAIDGKTLRRSHHRKQGQNPLHLVSAWASKNRLTLGQVKTDSKSNEITAIKELLALIDIKGCTVTIDAMGCQRDIAEHIIKAQGNYVLAVKGNQGNLFEDVIALFSHVQERSYESIVFSQHETLDGDHGRVETRCYTVLPVMYKFDYQKQWPGLQSFIQVASQREVDGKISTENRYYISSLKPDALILSEAIRQHWAIENTLHWSLDVTFNEDQSRIRKGHAPENIAMLRRFVLSLLKNETTFKGGLRRKQRKALMDKNYLNLILATI